MFNVGGQRIYEVEFKSKVVSCDEISDKLSGYKVVDTLHVTKPQNGFDRFYMSSQDILKIFDFFVVWYKLYTFNRPRRLPRRTWRLLASPRRRLLSPQRVSIKAESPLCSYHQ